MKLSELRPCASCGGKLAPIWYVIRVSQAMLRPQVFGGNLALAEAFSPEPDAVLVTGDAEPELMTELHICQECVLTGRMELALLIEKVSSARV